ncbi:aspartate carbamoyltransferase, partial [Microgenomates group bacterium]|nr:aspartate carbamoyltransferase [Microgenomates group bacterium]
RLKDKFILTRHMVTLMKKNAIVMHPLPRVGEILYEVDEDKRAKYFEQMRSGLYVRMAILKSILCQ